MKNINLKNITLLLTIFGALTLISFSLNTGKTVKLNEIGGFEALDDIQILFTYLDKDSDLEFITDDNIIFLPKNLNAHKEFSKKEKFTANGWYYKKIEDCYIKEFIELYKICFNSTKNQVAVRVINTN
jgi:hypothetical protein